mgnify:CR=1 FL=1
MTRPTCLGTTKVSLPVAPFLIFPSTNAIMPWLIIAFVKRLLLMSFGSFTSVERSIRLMFSQSSLGMSPSGHLSNPSFFGVDSLHKLRPSLFFGMDSPLLYRVVKHISYRGECQLRRYFLPFLGWSVLRCAFVLHLLIVLSRGLLSRESEIQDFFTGELRANSCVENPPKRTQHL